MSTLFVRVIVWKQLTWLLMVVIIPCTLMLPTSFILEMLYMKMVIQHWCMFLGNKICVQILWLRKDHMQGALLAGTAIRLTWNLSFWEISLDLSFASPSFSFFFLPRYFITLKKSYSIVWNTFKGVSFSQNIVKTYIKTKLKG